MLPTWGDTLYTAPRGVLPQVEETVDARGQGVGRKLLGRTMRLPKVPFTFALPTAVDGDDEEEDTLDLDAANALDLANRTSSPLQNRPRGSERKNRRKVRTRGGSG